MPSALWMTPAARPRTNRCPFFLVKWSGVNPPVTRRPSARRTDDARGQRAGGRVRDRAGHRGGGPGRRGRLRGGREAGRGGDHGEAENARDDQRGQTPQAGRSDVRHRCFPPQERTGPPRPEPASAGLVNVGSSRRDGNPRRPRVTLGGGAARRGRWGRHGRVLPDPEALDATDPLAALPRALRRHRRPAGLPRRQLPRPAAGGHRRAAAHLRRGRVGRPADPGLGRGLVRPAADPRRRAGPASASAPRPARSRSATPRPCCSTS